MIDPPPGDGHEHEQALAEPPAEAVRRAAAMFRAAGEPSRFKLLAQLADGERCVGELTSDDASMSAVSQRLRVLRNAGLVRRRREGKHAYYSLADAHIEELVRSALEHGQEEHTYVRTSV